MMQENKGRQPNHKRLWLALGAVAVLLAILIVPPLVSVARYKSRITQLVSTSLGRPVRMSSVEMRVLPRPGFVLSDLSVAEDPAFGTEPLLHASSVTAYIRLLSLWRGRLEIGTISVDDASLNLVRASSGHWNFDPLLRTAASSQAAAAVKSVPLPYLEATNSRINIKAGVEKLPFSLVDADLSFWQQNPGDWRVRLRGQPARTDLSLETDTGIVRLEASMRRAPELRKMPIHLDLEWREAQLGQLTRLVLGSDAGWRGDLTGELHLDGTAEQAQVKTRLRAIGVHRAEFAPAAPLDFDANCSLVAHFSTRAIDNLACDSPLGSGRVHIAGEWPGNDLPSRLSVEVQQIPVTAALDALRTVRRGLSPDLKAAGSVTGKMTYAPAAQESTEPAPPVRLAKTHVAKPHSEPPAPLTGSFTVDGFQLSGGGLSEPIRIPKLLLEPAAAQPSDHQALTATVAIPAGGAVPLTLSTRLALSGYQVTVHGQASIARAREFAHVSGMESASALDTLAGEPLQIDLNAEGPWMAPRRPLGQLPTPATSGAPVPVAAPGDTLAGTVTLHNSNWKADYLANHVEISQATLHLEPGQLRWDPVAFSYGPLKGTARVNLPSACPASLPCSPRIEVQFGALDASAFQTAVLGAQKPGTVLSTLIDRLRSSSAPAWPEIDLTFKAESLLLGPVTLRDFQANLRTLQTGAEITGFEAGLLGGKIHGNGAFQLPSSAQGKPAYALEGQFEKLSPPEVGKLLGLRWSGGTFDGNGKLELSGFTGKDLTASAKGALHFDWLHGAAGPQPAALARFDRWVADAEIANGSVTLKQNQVHAASHNATVQASVAIADPPKAVFASDKPLKAKR
jgi:hypothetical protein